MKPLSVFLALLLAFMPLAQAQDLYEVTVYCHEAGKPIVGAEVQLGTRYLNITNYEGIVTFPNVEGGRYTLKVMINGTMRHQKDVSVYDSTIFALDFSE